MPKLRGGSLKKKSPYSVVQLGDIQLLADVGNTDITLDTLKNAGYIRGNATRVKLLSGGELTTSVTLSVHAASQTAKSQVEKSGGTLTLVV